GVGTDGAIRNCRPGFADCVREFRELANDAGGCGAPGTGDSGGPGRGPRPAHPENADRNALLHSPVGMQKCKSRSAPAPGSRTMSETKTSACSAGGARLADITPITV